MTFINCLVNSQLKKNMEKVAALKEKAGLISSFPCLIFRHCNFSGISFQKLVLILFNKLKLRQNFQF